MSQSVYINPYKILLLGQTSKVTIPIFNMTFQRSTRTIKLATENVTGPFPLQKKYQ